MWHSAWFGYSSPTTYHREARTHSPLPPTPTHPHQSPLLRGDLEGLGEGEEGQKDAVNVVALVESPQHVCCRYRLGAFEPALRREGWSLECVPLGQHSSWWRTERGKLQQADVVILQRRLLPLWKLRVLRQMAAVLIYDFDDAVFLRDSYASRPAQSARRLLRFRAIIATADLVIAGNHFLAVHAARWTRPEQVCVVPTCVEPAQYPLAPHRRCGKGVELVWIGSRSTVQSFERARPVLEEVGRRVPGLRLRVICDHFPELNHIEVIRRRWSQATEAAELAEADIGISCLPDDLWSRGKCGLKVLQYMAAALPVVANPVGVQGALVRAGQTGYLPTNVEEWCQAIVELARDPPRRRTLGEHGRRLVEEHYSLERWAPEFMRILHRAIPARNLTRV